VGRLADKVAFVTGAGGAIGGAISRRFAAEGAAVACLDVVQEQAEKTAKSIADAGGRSVSIPCDASNSAEVSKALELAANAFGGMDILVHTAANEEPSDTVVDLAEADWNRTLAVNLTSAFILSKLGIPWLAAKGGGNIVIVASQLGQVVVPRRPAYVTTKAALIHLTRALAVDHAKDRIRVNALSPGAIETSRIVIRYGSMEAARNALTPLHPIGRLGQPDEIAKGALFLASDDSSFMTGADLVMDGGYTCL
jgi:NAD(P)-dependent dehydrogenase (short-subunit alcohol dehydrogenase family)